MGRKSEASPGGSIQKSMQALKESLDKPSEVEAQVESVLVEIVPTMSKTDLLLTCPWPWGRRVPIKKAGSAARLGSGLHKAMEYGLQRVAKRKQALSTEAVKPNYEKLAKEFDCPADELKMRFESAWPVIGQWLAGDNPWGLNFIGQHEKCFIEQSVAFDVEEGTARRIGSPRTRDHVYEGCRSDELPGTVDLAIVAGKYLLILDWKTGDEVPEVHKSGQLRSLSLAFSRLLDWREEIIIGFGHMSWTGVTTMYTDSIGQNELKEHATKLKDAFRQRGGTWLHPHTDCPICPAFTVCPTQASALDIIRQGRRALTTREEVGSAHYHLQMYRKAFSKLDEVVSEEIRSAVAEMGACPRPDGKMVDLVKRPFTNLSMSAIKRQLGEVEGKKLIDQLEKMGAIEHGERFELREVNDQ